MRRGKLTIDELNMAIADYQIVNDEVLFGVGVGEDCALFESKGRLLITTDPITGECNNIEELIVNINMNDIYAGGGVPFLATLTVLAPTDEPSARVVEIIRRVGEIARSKGIDIVGGHTEFTDAVNRMVLSMTMIGRAKNKISNSPKAGDEIIATKSLGIEAAKICLSLKGNIYELTDIQLAEIIESDLSVGVESAAVGGLKCVTSMHDITEGGVCSAVSEMTANSRLGAKIYFDKLPILSGIKKICQVEGYDIGYTISSGSMLIMTNDSGKVVKTLKKFGVSCNIIGEVIEGESYLINSRGENIPIEVRVDQLWNMKEKV